MPDYPTDNENNPICARPCNDGLPCYRQVQLPGVACYLHDDDQPVLPLPEDVPAYDTQPDTE